MADYVRDALVHLGIVDDASKIVDNLVAKMNKLESGNSGSHHKVTIGADDKVTSTINSITSALKGINKATGMNLVDVSSLEKASSIIDKINKSFNLMGTAKKTPSAISSIASPSTGSGNAFSGWSTTMSGATSGVEDLAAGEGAATAATLGLSAATLARRPIRSAIRRACARKAEWSG